MSDWHFVIADPFGDASGELTSAKTRTITWQLDAAAVASFSMSGGHPQTKLITETETDLIVFEGSTARFRGRLGSSTDALSSAGHQCQFSAVDYRGFLDRRIIWPGSTIAFSATDQIGRAHV